jgi:hypothetical protein
MQKGLTTHQVSWGDFNSEKKNCTKILQSSVISPIEATAKGLRDFQDSSMCVKLNEVVNRP